ncbi:MAG TPA: class I SAM-dependent methyltransferase [Marmoricola sp.]|nr:class I SAM-dependent methyltransferase [Marmoricola sp.]
MTEDQRPEGLTGSRPPHDFEGMYVAGRPPWDIGRPQSVFRELAERGGLVGRVLDIGCGTGEHALMAAAAGLEATGVDASSTALTLATRKAGERDLSVRFLTWDALELSDLGESFDTVLDCGLFHVFDDPERPKFVDALRASTRPGSWYYLLCFSDLEPGDWGPRRIRQDEIRAAFSEGWRVEQIESAQLETIIDPGAVHAWFASIRRV